MEGEIWNLTWGKETLARCPNWNTEAAVPRLPTYTTPGTDVFPLMAGVQILTVFLSL